MGKSVDNNKGSGIGQTNIKHSHNITTDVAKESLADALTTNHIVPVTPGKTFLRKHMNLTRVKAKPPKTSGLNKKEKKSGKSNIIINRKERHQVSPDTDLSVDYYTNFSQVILLLNMSFSGTYTKEDIIGIFSGLSGFIRYQNAYPEIRKNVSNKTKRKILNIEKLLEEFYNLLSNLTLENFWAPILKMIDIMKEVREITYKKDDESLTELSKIVQEEYKKESKSK